MSRPLARLLDEQSPLNLLRWFAGKYVSVEVRLQEGQLAHFAEYDTIRDTDALAALNQRILSVVGCSYTVSPGGSSSRDRRFADFIREHLQDFNFPGLCGDLLNALGYGFLPAQIDLSEEMIARRLRTIVKRTSSVHPDRVRLFRASGRESPDRSYLDGYEIRRITRAAPYDGEPIPNGRLIVHRYAVPGLIGTPYGCGYYGLLYPYLVGFKREVLRYTLLAAENFALPTLAFEETEDYLPSEENADRLQKIGDGWGADSYAQIPYGIRVQLLEASRAGNREFFGWLLDYLDRAATKLVLAQTLTTSAGASGSYALGTVQDAIKADGDRAIADMLARTIRTQLFRTLRDRNDPQAAIPHIKFDLRNEAVRHQSAQTDEILARASGRALDPEFVENKYNVKLSEPAANAES